MKRMVAACDVDELHQILRYHIDDLSQTQGEITEETFFEHRKRAEVAARHGISVHTYDNHLQAAYRSLRDSMKTLVDSSTDLDRPYCYDLVEELIERYSAKSPRRLSAKKGKRSTSKGDRSNSERDRGKNSRAGAA